MTCTAENKRRFGFVVFLVCLGLLGTGLASPDPELRRDLERRRALVMEKMEHRGMMVLFSADPKNKTGDVDYEFRQENNIFYLTGITQSGIALVLIPENRHFREILFLPRRSPAREVWNGRTLSADEARTISGIATVWDATELDRFFNDVLSRKTYPQGEGVPTDYDRFFRAITEGTAQVFLQLPRRGGTGKTASRESELAEKIQKGYPGVQTLDTDPIFSALRMVKSDYEIRQIRRAVDITAEALLTAFRSVRPGQWEYETEAVIEAAFRRNNADWAYPSIVGSGNNSTTLHYSRSSSQQLDGEVLLMDVGAEYNYYAADITRTIPVNGRFSNEQREIYTVVLEAQEEALKLVRPGMTLGQIHLRATDVIREGLFKLGLIADRETDQHRNFFMHGTCHFVGLDVHDVGRRDIPLEPGMIFTIEPGIYVREDALDHLPDTVENRAFIEKVRKAVDRYRNIGVRIEDDILVTPSGYEVLSSRIPRTIADIEKVMAERTSP